jgi:hypothetical protein
MIDYIFLAVYLFSALITLVAFIREKPFEEESLKDYGVPKNVAEALEYFMIFCPLLNTFLAIMYIIDVVNNLLNPVKDE